MTTLSFNQMCQALGYEPATVLSIRVNNQEVVVTYLDPAGTMCLSVLRTPCPADEPPAASTRETGAGSAPAAGDSGAAHP